MFIADSHERKYPESYPEKLERERREFIRTAAIKIAVTGTRSENTLSAADEYGMKTMRTKVNFPSAAEAVDQATALWEELLQRDC